MLPVTLLNDLKAFEIQGGVKAKKAVALLTKFADSLCSLLYKGWKEWKKKSLHLSQATHPARANPGFHSMKQLRVS